MSNNADFLREQLIDEMKRRGSLNDPLIEAAFRAVPRHLFLPHVPLEVSYADSAIPVEYSSSGIITSLCSQPSTIAAMLAQLRLEPGQNILEIGSGTGYSAALIQFIVGEGGRVTTIEADQSAANRARDSFQRLSLGSKITLVEADGALGYAPRAAYDRIIASAAIWDVPAAWVRQLKPAGILVCPVWLDSLQVSAALQRQPDGSLLSSENIPVSFPALRGPAAAPNMYRRVGSSPLILISSNSRSFDTAALHVLLSEDAEVNFLGYPLTRSDYWLGLMPYLMLNMPSGYRFALYELIQDNPVYNLDSAGFALIGQVSACFIPYDRDGSAVCFASSDAVVEMQAVVAQWHDEGRIGADRLRLRLVPVALGMPPTSTGRIYARYDHFLHICYSDEKVGTP
jgi:protein-L-isoaspartate(D-aspartate) O-methyltransferase